MEDKNPSNLDEDKADKKENTDASIEPKNEKNAKQLKKKLIYLFSTVGLSAFFCSFYYWSMSVPGILFPIVMFSYMIVLTILVLVYIIYNRGFSRKGVTEDMLPLEWSSEKKREFIESGVRRLQRSKWLLVLIISIFFTFIVEAFVLFVF